MDALEIIATLRGKGLDPILIEVGSNRVEFRLGLHIANDDEREHWSSHLSYFNLGVIVDNGNRDKLETIRDESVIGLRTDDRRGCALTTIIGNRSSLRGEPQADSQDGQDDKLFHVIWFLMC